jgi:hypothetical protein
MLARTMSDLNREQRTLREEGSVCMSEKGNSGSQSEEVGSSDARRFLALHARAHTRDLADIAKRQGKAIAIAADNPLDDGLIARPN